MGNWLRRLYGAVPDFLMTVLHPFLRAGLGQTSPLLRRFEVPHEVAVYVQGLDHWGKRAIDLDLVNRARILDLGCGSGQWLEVLARYNREVIGVEPEARILSLAADQTRNNSKISLVRAQAEAVPFKDQSFDALLCYGVLSYTDAPMALGEMARVLRAGGRLVLGLQGLGYYLHHLVEGVKFHDRGLVRYGIDPILTRLGQALFGRPRHGVTYWTRRRIQRLLKGYGLELVHARASVDDPSWKESFLGLRYFFCAEAQKLPTSSSRVA